MDKELLLEEAFAFFSLSPESSPESIKERYHVLAKKYHPDSGEFTSPVLFQELQKYHEILLEWQAFGLSVSNSQSKNSTEPSEKKKDTSDSKAVFSKYKAAKELETNAILRYYERTKNQPLILKGEENPALLELRKELLPVRKELEEIAIQKPPSIWSKDARDSLKRISVWWD